MATDTSVKKDIIAGLILSTFDRDGPTPKVCFPSDMDEANQLLIAMKSISLLMGEQVYQEGKAFDSIKYFGILPFPDLKLTGLTYFFLIYDEKSRGKAKASTISLMVSDIYASFLYENMKQLSIFMAETAAKIDSSQNEELYEEFMAELRDRLINYMVNLNGPVTTDRKLKILFTGLDGSGKTSFLRSVKQKYSELIGIKPTKGIERTEQTLLNAPLVEWDVGGQSKYRSHFIKQADLYLYDTNLLFFLVDVRDTARYTEAIDFFSQIIKVFTSFKQSPPIIINLHKIDPDLSNDDEFHKQITKLRTDFLAVAAGFKIHFFETSIFNPYSLIKSFSEGITAMSPNRELCQGQLKWLSHELDAKSILLINENSVIISDYSVNDVSGKVSEMSAPHFASLFRTFAEFKILKKDNAIWHMDDDVIFFYQVKIDNNALYLLCLLKEQEKIKQKFEALLPEFKERIKPLISSYL